RRKARSRAKLVGTATRPRLSVYRSLQYIYASLVDDTAGVVLAASTDKVGKNAEAMKGNKVERAQAVGTQLAEQAKAKGITQAVFDRGGRAYHGRVKALADAAREAGLEF